MTVVPFERRRTQRPHWLLPLHKRILFILALLIITGSQFLLLRPAAAQTGTNCLFFTEAGAGQGGFSVCNDGQAQFRTAFERWGLQRVGYPISTRYTRDGFVTQAFQKAIFQWRADTNSVVLVNTFDDLHNAGFDQRLLDTRQTPNQLPANWDTPGATFQQIVERRQGLLNTRPALRQAYFSAADPLLFYGLPTSEVTDMGNHYAIRLQRAVLQEWKEAVPWAAAGQVTVANGGDIAKELGSLPITAIRPEPAPGTGGTVPTPPPSTPPTGPVLQPVPPQPAPLAAELEQRVHAATIGIRHPVGNPLVSGSGIVVGNDGRTFITAYHVIEASPTGFPANIVSVGPFADWRYTAEVIATAPELDIAILRVREPDFPGFAVAPVGSSSALNVGDPIYTYSYPGGEGALVPGRGSYLIELALEEPEGFSLIATDAFAFFGSSGGVAVNAQGQVIGIIDAGIIGRQNVEAITGYTGINQVTLLVPIDDVAALMQQAGVSPLR